MPRILLEQGDNFVIEALYRQDARPPIAVRNAAKRGLALRKKYGRGGLSPRAAGRQRIGSGVARAMSLAKGQDIPPKTLRRMRAFFSRHQKHKNTPPQKGNGKIAWLLWGGDPGRRWVERELGSLNKTRGIPHPL